MQGSTVLVMTGGPGPAENAPVQYRRLKRGPGSPVIFKIYIYV